MLFLATLHRGLHQIRRASLSAKYPCFYLAVVQFATTPPGVALPE
jgi:hypothetical protein